MPELTAHCGRKRMLTKAVINSQKDKSLFGPSLLFMGKERPMTLEENRPLNHHSRHVRGS